MTDAFWTEERIVKAEELWAQGLTARAIAELIGSKKNTVINLAYKQRARFPIRQRPRIPSQIYVIPPPVTYPDRVKRITFSGAEVTMPRVPTIDGPAPCAPQQGEIAR